jgi:hypothetical protein
LNQDPPQGSSFSCSDRLPSRARQHTRVIVDSVVRPHVAILRCLPESFLLHPRVQNDGTAKDGDNLQHAEMEAKAREYINVMGFSKRKYEKKDYRHQECIPPLCRAPYALEQDESSHSVVCERYCKAWEHSWKVWGQNVNGA